MSPIGRIASLGALLVALSSPSAPPLAAQGVTTAAMRGTITREDANAPIEGAVLTLISRDKGTRLRAVSLSNGRYAFENVDPGEYNVEVRAIGFELTTKSGIVLTLGQRSIQDFVMKAQVVQIQELEVIATTDPLINSGRTGAAQIVSDSAIHRMPLLGRNFNSLLSGNPQVAVTSQGGASIAGQNNRYNTVLVDGSVNNDIFGLPAEGSPGGQANVKPLSIEAIKEFQVLVAPYDVRQGGFAGGLINAVTKSGTNDWTGSLFGYFQNRDLVGKDTTGAKFAEFNVKQYGGTIGGPIIRDKMHFFLSADIQQRDQPFVGADVNDPTVGITPELADRVTAAVRTQFGFDPGTYASPVLQTPNTTLFGKLSYQASANHNLELSYNFVDGFNDAFSRSTRNRNNRDGFQLSNSGFEQRNQTNSLRLKYLGQAGRISLEGIAAYQTIRDKREMPNEVPQYITGGNLAGNSFIAAGGERFSHGNSLDQDIIELTLNATMSAGNHQLTLGTHNEFFGFNNVFWEGKYGVWTFDNVTALETNAPSRYEIRLPVRPEGAVSDFGVQQFGLYLQDQWMLSDRLTLSLGARFDVPVNDAPATNPALASSTLGITTGDFPSGNMLVSPRLGFNWDISGQSNTILRGGVGLFTGRIPYVWLSNAFVGTGLETVLLTCTGASTPQATGDISSLPQTCLGGGGPTAGAADIVAFDKEFKFVQSLKYSLGLDQRLPGGVVGTIDFIHTRSRNTMYLNDENLVERTAAEGGMTAEGRQMYGTINPATGAAAATRIDPAFRTVLFHTNKSQDYSTVITGQLSKRFGSNLEFNAAYTWSEVKDVITLGSSTASSNFLNTVVNGTLANRRLATSALQVPHSIVVGGTADIPLGFYLSMQYNGRAGRPYSYITNGDANADGQASNDPIYVPSDASDITLTTPADFDRLNEWLAGEECLESQRGQLMERNSCSNPWVHQMNLRLGKRIATFGTQQMEVTADVFNFLNLVNNDWGLIRSNFGQSTEFEQRVAPMNVAGFDDRGTADPNDDRPRYTVPAVLPTRDQAVLNSSRWRIQLGIKYVF